MTNLTPNYAEIIQQTASQHYNVRDEYKNNTVEQNIAIQRSHTRKFSVGAINITGELNIGMMLRSACLMGAENFYIFGRKKFDRRSTVGAENYINIVQFTYDNPLTADQEMATDIGRLKDKHLLILCEQGGNELRKNLWSPSYMSPDVVKSTFEDAHPLFLFGSESHGVSQSIIDLVPPVARITIPQVGVLRSFNVSAAMNIIVFDYIRETYL